MISLEFIDADRRDEDFFAYVMTEHAPQKDSIVSLRLENKGYVKFRVIDIEYWYDCVENHIFDSVQCAVFVREIKDE